MSSNSTQILTIIEDAERGSQSCACGAPMIVNDDADGLWVECSDLARTPRGRIASFFAALTHERRLLISARELVEDFGQPFPVAKAPAQVPATDGRGTHLEPRAA